MPGPNEDNDTNNERTLRSVWMTVEFYNNRPITLRGNQLIIELWVRPRGKYNYAIERQTVAVILRARDTADPAVRLEAARNSPAILESSGYCRVVCNGTGFVPGRTYSFTGQVNQRLGNPSVYWSSDFGIPLGDRMVQERGSANEESDGTSDEEEQGASSNGNATGWTNGVSNGSGNADSDA
ncbi:hypothetical protein VTN96DRAFT_8638 [Rasamsonia emersonii]